MKKKEENGSQTSFKDLDDFFPDPNPEMNIKETNIDSTVKLLESLYSRNHSPAVPKQTKLRISDLNA